MSRVKAEYDFEAQPGSGEMSIVAGEILTVIRPNVEGGWMEGKNSRGESGLFPESYVTPCYDEPPPPPPPMMKPKPSLPPVPSSAPATSLIPSRPPVDDWGTSSFHPPVPSTGPPSVVPSLAQSGHHGGSVSQAVDDFDDEWTDEDETEESVQSGAHTYHHENRAAISRSQSATGGERSGSKVNRNINRFSNFVKSGMEAYILGESKMTTQPGERHEILLNGTMAQWKPIQKYYTCTVDKPKKETKLKGLKSFIAYSITSSLRGIQVARRYKHFDWLHDQLSAKYIMIPIPPLPEKQVSGRYEDDLIDHRKHILQLWVNKICRHPVLSQSEVWLHFISCTDERDWKNGKRKAEKDEFVGGNFLNCVTTPSAHLDTVSVERQVELFQRNVKTTEDSMRVMQERMQVFQKLFTGPVKSNWQKMALAFSTLGQSFGDDHPGSSKMSDALKHTAHHYHNIGEEFDVHTRSDMEPVVENLYSFKGTVQGVPEILQVHKQAVQKLRENEGKVSQSDADKMRERVNNASYVLLAEMNHLNSEKIEDLRVTMGTYLKKQAEFYRKISNNLAELAQHYEF